MRIIKVGGDIITFHYRYRKQIIISIILLLVLAALGIIVYQKVKDNKKTDEPVLISKKKEKESVEEEVAKEIEEEKYKVDIKGEIATPGIYEVPISSRVIDVINKAGGLTDNADTSVINLSKKISDEMVIIVYSKDEVKDFKKTKEIEEQVQNSCVQKDENALKNDACISSNETPTSTKISLNTATLEQLMTLPGIGEAKAKEIIDYRTTNGPFKSIDDLKNISGIGESLFAKIKENITI